MSSLLFLSVLLLLWHDAHGYGFDCSQNRVIRQIDHFIMPPVEGATFAQLNATFHVFTQLFGLPAPMGPIRSPLPPHSNSNQHRTRFPSRPSSQQFVSGMIAFGNVQLEINSFRPGGVAFQQCGSDTALSGKKLQRKNLSFEAIDTPGLWTNLMLTGFGRTTRNSNNRMSKRDLSQFPAWASEFYTFICQYNAFDQSELREASWKYILSQVATGPLGVLYVAEVSVGAAIDQWERIVNLYDLLFAPVPVDDAVVGNSGDSNRSESAPQKKRYVLEGGPDLVLVLSDIPTTLNARADSSMFATSAPPVLWPLAVRVKVIDRDRAEKFLLANGLLESKLTRMEKMGNETCCWLDTTKLSLDIEFAFCQ